MPRNAVYQRGVSRLSRPDSVGWLLGFLALIVTGCPTEVPFQAPEEGNTIETSEAPAFDPDASATASTEITAEPEPEPEPESDTAEPPADRYARTPPGRMPWESADGEADEGEVPDLFAQTGAAPATGRYAETADESEEDPEEESYADFLGDAYAGLLGDETEPEESDEPEASSIEESPVDELPRQSIAEPTVAAVEKEPSGLPFDVPEDLSFEPDDFDFEPKPRSEPKAKPPSTTQPADAEELDDLWADAEVTAPPATREPEVTEPEPPAAEPEVEGLPFDEPSLEDLFGDVREEPTEELAPAPEPVGDPLAEPAPDPEPTVPAPEPNVTRPAETPKPARTRASPGVKPLPSVPVLPFNTRHLAWLLGGKLALAELADLEGATPSEIADWDAEVERLARELKIRNPSLSPRPDNPAARVRAMMDAASRAGGELSRAYGPDHSALLEIAVKSNTLLIVAADRPDLALPVADAIRAAADDAMLPRFLWGEAIKTLTNGPTSEETADAVERLHRRVESFLR